jgi:hypothetical protein
MFDNMLVAQRGVTNIIKLRSDNIKNDDALRDEWPILVRMISLRVASTV